MLINLTPYISQHHRGYTTLTSEQGASQQCKKTVQSVGELLYGTNFSDTLLPLEERLQKDEKVRTKTEAWGLTLREILAAAALLRVVDGCDVQADRVVSEEYMKARLNRTRAEGEALWWELRPLLRGRWENFEGQVNRIHEISQSLGLEREAASDDELGALCKNVYAAVMDALLAIKAGGGGYLLTSENYGDLTALSLVNRYAFKWEQFLHFEKHRCVGFVLPVREKEKEEIIVKIFPNPECKSININKNLDDVERDIRKEIEGTGGLLGDLRFGTEVCIRHDK
jgi:hypothetical protein